MAILLLGILLWSGIHFIPALTPATKQRWQHALGEKGYMATFALAIFASIAVMVVGWRSIAPHTLYVLPNSVRGISVLLIFIALFLFFASHQTSRIKHYIRHPQLTGMLIWSIAHLLVNGDNRSWLLFGGLGVWAIIEILLLNKRNGVWEKPASPAWPAELKPLGIALAAFVILALLHPYIAGMPVI